MFGLKQITCAILAVAILIPIASFAQTVDEKEQQLRNELAQVEKEIAEQQAILNTKKGETASIERDIAILTARIKEATLTIKAKNLTISQLGKDITTKTTEIADLDRRLDRGRQSLEVLVRRTYQYDQFSLPEVLLSSANLSEFFKSADQYNQVRDALEVAYTELQSVREKTDTAKQTLTDRQNREMDAKKVIEAEQRNIQKSEADKKVLLSISKSQEGAYQKIINERNKRAAQIRAALFALRDSEGIPFGDALKYANEASLRTGVRPALILAILTQESDLGKNVGACLITNLSNGDGIGKKSGVAYEQVMKAPRDTSPFASITSRLGLDWKMTPISCPPGTKWTSSRGYGGAMGPSQFIPSTWELFKARIGSAAGVSADQADPWNPEHAFIATALYMGDLGAKSGSYTSEWNAACKYYSGSACKYGRKPANVPYGDQVMQKAQNIQENMIDLL